MSLEAPYQTLWTRKTLSLSQAEDVTDEQMNSDSVMLMKCDVMRKRDTERRTEAHSRSLRAVAPPGGEKEHMHTRGAHPSGGDLMQ